jgi:hypothetical protein
MHTRIVDYVENTQADKHSKHFKIEVLDIFEVRSQAEAERYQKDIGNRHLLWHGSRLTNYVGILSQGLRVAPP